MDNHGYFSDTTAASAAAPVPAWELAVSKAVRTLPACVPVEDLPPSEGDLRLVLGLDEGFGRNDIATPTSGRVNRVIANAVRPAVIMFELNDPVRPV